MRNQIGTRLSRNMEAPGLILALTLAPLMVSAPASAQVPVLDTVTVGWSCTLAPGPTEAFLVANGSNFTSTNVIELNGIAFPTTFRDGEEVSTYLSSSTNQTLFNTLRSGGSITMRVRLATGSTTVSAGVSFSGNAAPSLTSISPSSVSTGSGDATFTLNGSGFRNDASQSTRTTIRVSTSSSVCGPADIAMTIPSPSQGTFVLPASYMSTAQTLYVRAINFSSNNSGGMLNVSNALELNVGGQPCVSTGNVTSVTLSASGSTGTLGVSASPPGCAWTVIGVPPWMTINPLSGTGSTTVTYTVQPNPGEPRFASLTIAGNSFNMNQSGINSSCAYTLAPATAIISNTGGSGNFQVASSCAWSASSLSSWITITGGANGSGNGTVSYSVQALPAGEPARSGIVLVNGALFRVTQNPGSCTFTVSPEQLDLPASRVFADELTVTASPSGCAWSASSSVPWLTILSGSNGSLSGALIYSTGTNTGAQRTGTLTVAGRTIPVTQASGTSCPTTLAPISAIITSAGSPGATLTVNTPCSWTAASSVPWIQILSGSPGNGSGPLVYRVEANTSAAIRTGTITVANHTFTVTQAPAAPCSFSLGSQSVSMPAAGGAVSVPINTLGACGWSVTTASVPSWITITQGTGSGSGFLRFNVAANSGTTPRTAQLQVAGRTIFVNQAGAPGFSCNVLTPTPVPQVRSEGAAELIADLVVECQGNASRAIVSDVVVRLNTNVTSRPLNPLGAVESLLLVNDSPSPQLGVTAFGGILAGNDAVRFPAVPLASAGANTARRFRIVNLRADATTPNLPAGITATLQIPAVGVSNPRQTVAQHAPSIAATLDPAVAVNNGITIPISFRELIPDTFRLRLSTGQDPSTPGTRYGSESGFVNSSLLGPNVGLANTSTRLMVRLRNLPAESSVLASAAPSNLPNNARLVTPEPSGTGVGVLSGGATQLIPVVEGEAVLTWEITSANNTVNETLTFPVTITGATMANASSITSASTAFLGPIQVFGASAAQQPVPRFRSPGASRRSYSLRISAAINVPSLDLQERNSGLIARDDATGGRSFEVTARVTNDSDVPTPETTIRGNLSAGITVSEQCAAGDSRGSCQGSESSALATIPSLEPGQSVVAVMNAQLRAEAEDSLVQLEATGNSDFTVVTDSQERCLGGFSETAIQPLATGQSGSFKIYACGAWSISVLNTPWLTLSATSGTGNATINYTVTANPGPSSREVTLLLPGGAALVISQPASQTPNPQTTGLRFVPVTPCRLLETRSFYAGATWTGAYGPPRFNAGQTRTLPIAGGARCGIPASAKAFVLNVTLDTVEENTGPVDFVTIYPTGQARPNFFTARTTSGGYIANSAIVEAGTGGAVSIYASNSVHILIDISGYFTDDANAGLLFYPFGPCRAVDTRSVYSNLPAPYGFQKMQSRETRTFRLPGSPNCQGLPSAAAYSLQMTLAPGDETNGTPVAYVTGWPTGQAQPIVSNMNAYYGYSVANSGIIPAGPNGNINVFAFDPTNVILDVNGYFGPDDGTGRGLRFFPVPQCRILNTQSAVFGGNYGPPAMTSSTPRVVSIPGGGCAGLPASARAFALNAWVVPGGTPMPFLSMWPAGLPWPVVSQLNAFQGQSVANSAIVPVDDAGRINLIVNATTHVGLETSGYFARGTTTPANPCTPVPVTLSQPVNGTLSASDCASTLRAGSRTDRFSFSGTAGQRISISLTAAAFDTYLFLLQPDGTVLASDDDGGDGVNSRIPAGSGALTLPANGTYTIEVTSFASGDTGAYTLTVSPGA